MVIAITHESDTFFSFPGKYDAGDDEEGVRRHVDNLSRNRKHYIFTRTVSSRSTPPVSYCKREPYLFGVPWVSGGTPLVYILQCILQFEKLHSFLLEVFVCPPPLCIVCVPDATSAPRLFLGS